MSFELSLPRCCAPPIQRGLIRYSLILDKAMTLESTAPLLFPDAVNLAGALPPSSPPARAAVALADELEPWRSLKQFWLKRWALVAPPHRLKTMLVSRGEKSSAMNMSMFEESDQGCSCMNSTNCSTLKIYWTCCWSCCACCEVDGLWFFFSCRRLFEHVPSGYCITILYLDLAACS